jgi:glycosyltransferase involved in cell wall biosynthesis
MKILILTQYFPPETGAPQNRLYELAVRLQKMGAQITVLTAMPNYPDMEIHQEYNGCFYKNEKLDNLDVHRAFIFVSKKKSVFFRLANYFSFVFSSILIGLTKVKNQDYILCESPPLFLGISALLLKKIKGAKLIFNVSDLWPESAEKLGIVTNKAAINASAKLEEFLYKHSDIITGQTKGIVNNISLRFPQKRVYWIPNGADTNLYMPDITSSWRIENGFSTLDFIILYAGIIGYAQGLEVLLLAAKELIDYSEIKFVIIGNGPEKDKLLKMKSEMNISNVYFFDAVSKSKIKEVLAGVDLTIAPLKKLDLFKGAIPSKIFESLAMEKPILLGVEGEAKELFIDEANAGLFYTPEDKKDLSLKVVEFYTNRDLVRNLGKNGRKYVLLNFSRDTIAKKLWEIIC